MAIFGLLFIGMAVAGMVSRQSKATKLFLPADLNGLLGLLGAGKEVLENAGKQEA